MARTKPIRRSYGAGEWGRNRVRVFPDPKTGLFQIEWRENGRRLTRSLKHRDWRRAKRQADEFAAGYLGPELHRKADAESEPLTKCEQARRHDRAAMRMFLGCFGRDRKPATLSQRDWDRFIRERRAGRVGPSGKPVADRMIERDLKFLLAVLNWAVKSRDERGELLLGSNPLKGLKTPKEKNPVRVVLSEEEYQALLEVSRPVDWRFRVALVLAHETGHRIDAIRQLRWLDIDMEGRVVRWRAEHEKSGYEHRTPVTAEALAAFREARTRNPETGDAPVLPSPKYRSRCVSCSWTQRLVGEGRSARRAGIQAWPRLAFPEAEVRLRPHGPAAQGALRTRWLEGRPRRCCTATSGPMRHSSGRLWKAAAEFAPDPNRRESDGGNPVRYARKFNNHINIQNCGRLPSRLRGTITSI